MLETLLILLLIVWLAVTVVVVALCRMAAGADAASQRVLQEPSSRAGRIDIAAAARRRLAAHSH
jgi:Flp pilus assembly protein TadG